MNEQLAETVNMSEPSSSMQSLLRRVYDMFAKYELEATLQRWAPKDAEAACDLATWVEFKNVVEQAGAVGKPFESAAIMGDPGYLRISMSFEKRQQYEAALAFLDMGDWPAGRCLAAGCARPPLRGAFCEKHNANVPAPEAWVDTPGYMGGLNASDD